MQRYPLELALCGQIECVERKLVLLCEVLDGSAGGSGDLSLRRCRRLESAIRLRDRHGRACAECVLQAAPRGEFCAVLAETSSGGRDRDRPGPRNPVWCTSRRRVGCSSQPLPTWHGTLGRQGCRSHSASFRPLSQPLRWTDPWSHSSSSVGCQIRARRRWCELLNPATAGYRLRIGWVSKSESATLPNVTPGCSHVDTLEPWNHNQGNGTVTRGRAASAKSGRKYRIRLRTVPPRGPGRSTCRCSH